MPTKKILWTCDNCKFVSDATYNDVHITFNYNEILLNILCDKCYRKLKEE